MGGGTVLLSAEEANTQPLYLWVAVVLRWLISTRPPLISVTLATRREQRRRAQGKEMYKCDLVDEI